MERIPAIRFAHVVRRLGAAARAAGLDVPAFRSPPRRPGAVRTIRRLPGGTVVAVQLRGRGYDDVVADLVDGVVCANRLAGAAAQRVRADLVAAVAEPELPPSVGPARVAERQTQAA